MNLKVKDVLLVLFRHSNFKSHRLIYLMMNIENFITRLDEELIQMIVGKSALQILNTLNNALPAINTLQSIVLKVYSPTELLDNKKIRDEFIDLLREDEAVYLCNKIGLAPKGNVYNKLKSVNYILRKEKQSLHELFELDVEEKTNRYAINTKSIAKPQYPLFKHQRKAIAEITNLLYTHPKRVMLHMPTGSGKTRTAMNIICTHLRKNENTTVIWLAHTEELCEQAAKEFEIAWANLGDREIYVIRYWGKNGENISRVKDAFIVGSLTKVYKLLQSDAAAISTLASNCTLVIMDEAHMAIAPTYKDNLNVLVSFGSSLLGLSATPGRTWNDPNADINLSNYFYRQKVTLKVDGYDNPVNYLVNEGFLASVHNHALFYNNGFQISNNDVQYLKRNLQLSDTFLKSLSEDQLRNILIINKIEELVKRHKRIILFAINIEHSNLLATCLQGRGINAYSITSNTDSSQRKYLIDKFKGDEDYPIVLCNYGILTTGFDAPKTSCALIARPTDSLVLYSQMVGRAIRGIKAGGNLEAEIVTVVDSNLPGFDHIANAFFNWEDIW